MNAVSADLSQSRASGFGLAKTKLLWLAQVLRLVSAGYAAWVLWRVMQWWTDGDKVIKHMGLYLERDLSVLPASARLLALGLDLAAWLLLAAAVVCAWKSLGLLIRQHTFTEPMARLLALAGWLGVLCELSSLLSRPLQSYLMTAHLPATQQLFKWAFYPQDLLATLLCGVLLCFAYLIAWTLDIAEENRGFV